MSWYRLPSGMPFHADDGSNLAIRLQADPDTTVLLPEEVDAAVAAYLAGTAGPEGHPLDWVTTSAFAAALATVVAQVAAADDNLDGLVTAATTAKTGAETAKTGAEIARTDAIAAAASIQREQTNGVMGIGADGKIADEDRLPDRLSQTGLAATYAPTLAGPRALPRVKQGLAPTLHVDNVFPRTALGEWDHRILSTEGATWWAFGRDGSLRKSTTEGNTWFRTYKAANTGQLGKDGIWLTTAAGSLITSWHPYDGSAPSIMRASAAGSVWTTVVTPVTGVQFLGPTSLCQSPVTGNLYLAEYITTTPAANPTVRIHVSPDDGVTWSVWKTLSRAYDTDPADGVMHVHGIQVDPIDNRIWVAVGDAPLSAGLYRLTVDESGWAAIATNRMLDTASGIWGGAVGIMFFPTHIAWGVDQSFSSGLVRMARTEIGQPFPVVDQIMKLNSSAFYTCRTDTTNTEWVLSASQEGGASAVDNAIHLYRVADNGATCDELSAIPVNTATSFSWAFPLGTPLQTRVDKLMWWGTNVYDGQGNAADLEMIGMQFSCRVGWSHDVLLRQNPGRKYTQPVTVSSGLITGIAAGVTKNFAATIVPSRARRLYVLELGSKSWTAGPVSSIEITDSAGTIINTDVATPIAVATVAYRASGQDDAVPYLIRTAKLNPGDEVRFRLKNTSGSLTIDASGFVTYAWGY